MAACGRLLPFKSSDFRWIERPLLVEADVQPGAREIGLPNGCYALQSGHWVKLVQKGRY